MGVRSPRRQGDEEPTSDDEGTGAAAPVLHLVGADVYPDWETIYRDNVDRVYRLMFSRVGNRPDAEDLTTEVFVAALRPLRTTASVAEVRSYLLATARTVLASYWRRTLGRPLTTFDDERVDLAFADTDPGPGLDQVARAEAILAELSENYRRILQLRFLHGRSIKDSAAELGVSVSNAKVLQHRALRAAARAAERIGGR